MREERVMVQLAAIRLPRPRGIQTGITPVHYFGYYLPRTVKVKLNKAVSYTDFSQRVHSIHDLGWRICDRRSWLVDTDAIPAVAPISERKGPWALRKLGPDLRAAFICAGHGTEHFSHSSSPHISQHCSSNRHKLGDPVGIRFGSQK
jgi:hypothetical protein